MIQQLFVSLMNFSTKQFFLVHFKSDSHTAEEEKLIDHYKAKSGEKM